MSLSGSCSNPTLRWASVCVALWFAAALHSTPKVHLTREAALVKAFGAEAVVERRTAYLSEEQVAAARELAGPGVEVRSAMVVGYTATLNDTPLGTVYFDTHRVRTLQETLMVAVDPQAKILRIDVVTFDEPQDYQPRDAWFRQFDGLPLDPELALKRGIHGITGATLSAEAATQAVRRVLAVHTVLVGATP